MKAQLLILSLFLLSCNATKRAKSTYGPALFQHWTHSYEDDGNGITVYRPDSYDFPPSRGREGFELKETGDYIRYAIGPADGTKIMEGSWEMKGKDQIVVTLPETKQPPFTMTIVSVEPDMLKVRK